MEIKKKRMIIQNVKLPKELQNRRMSIKKREKGIGLFGSVYIAMCRKRIVSDKNNSIKIKIMRKEIKKFLIDKSIGCFFSKKATQKLKE